MAVYTWTNESSITVPYNHNYSGFAGYSWSPIILELPSFNRILSGHIYMSSSNFTLIEPSPGGETWFNPKFDACINLLNASFPYPENIVSLYDVSCSYAKIKYSSPFSVAIPECEIYFSETNVYLQRKIEFYACYNAVSNTSPATVNLINILPGSFTLNYETIEPTSCTLNNSDYYAGDIAKINLFPAASNLQHKIQLDFGENMFYEQKINQNQTEINLDIPYRWTKYLNNESYKSNGKLILYTMLDDEILGSYTINNLTYHYSDKYYLTTDEELQTIGDAIRGKTSLSSQLLFPDAFIDAIENYNPEIVDIAYSIMNGNISEFIDSTITRIRYYLFAGCELLSIVSIAACKIIDSMAFPNCRCLEEIYSPEVSRIGLSAFLNCYNLKTASFPMCTSIGYSAFEKCSRLESLYLLAPSVTTLASVNIFSNAAMSTSTYLGHFGSIYVPSSLVNAYKTATNWATYAARIVGI